MSTLAQQNDPYPSRIGSEERILERRDPVLYGDIRPGTPHTLGQEQLESYEKNGFLVLPEYLPEMVEPLKREIESLRQKMVGCEELVTEPETNELRSIFRPYAFSEQIDAFSRDPRILNIVEQLLGSRAYIAQSRVNVKPAFKGKSFAWHSDFETWHVEDGMPRMRAVTAWIMLTESNEYNGPLYVIPGSHKEYISCAGVTEEKNYTKSLQKQVLGVPGPDTMRRILEKRDIAAVHGKPGTVVFHECNILHASPDNLSHMPRTLLMFVYNSCENAMVEPFSGQPPRPEYLRNPDPTPLESGGCGRDA